jgi:hypothetical protein
MSIFGMERKELGEHWRAVVVGFSNHGGWNGVEFKQPLQRGGVFSPHLKRLA